VFKLAGLHLKVPSNAVAFRDGSLARFKTSFVELLLRLMILIVAHLCMEQCTLKLEEVRMPERCRDGVVFILISGRLIYRQFKYRLSLFFLVFYRVYLYQTLQKL
jgi:hypothetical protein